LGTAEAQPALYALHPEEALLAIERVRSGRNGGKKHGRKAPVPSGRAYAKAEPQVLGYDEGDKTPHELHHVGDLIQKIIAPAISNKSCHPGKPEKVTDLLHDIHPHTSGIGQLDCRACGFS
jgi:hypothetical protein